VARRAVGRRWLVLYLLGVAGEARRAIVAGALLVRRVARGAVAVLRNRVELFALVGWVTARARRHGGHRAGAVRLVTHRAVLLPVLGLCFARMTARARRCLCRRVRLVAVRAIAVALRRRTDFFRVAGIARRFRGGRRMHLGVAPGAIAVLADRARLAGVTGCARGNVLRARRVWTIFVTGQALRVAIGVACVRDVTASAQRCVCLRLAVVRRVAVEALRRAVMQCLLVTRLARRTRFVRAVTADALALLLDRMFDLFAVARRARARVARRIVLIMAAAARVLRRRDHVRVGVALGARARLEVVRLVAARARDVAGG